MKDENSTECYKELEKLQSRHLAGIVDYIPDSVVDHLILKKPTGYIRVVSFDFGQELKRRISPFDAFIQVIEGNADVIIDNISHTLETGHGIIIPAHVTVTIRSDVRFKIIETIIQSGYE
jgi:quercetin dioxygenase-like cupin family protein